MNETLPIDIVIHLTRLKLYEAVAIDGVGRPDTVYIASKIGGGVKPAFVKMAFDQLEELEEVSATPVDKRWVAELLPAGARLVEADLRKPDSVVSQYRDRGLDAFTERMVKAVAVPASDRIVTLSDNQPEVVEVRQEIHRLEEQVRISNEVGEIFGDDRQIALEEISTLRAMFSRSRVRAAAAIAFASRSLGWIAEKGAAAAVGEAAKRLLQLIINLFS